MNKLLLVLFFILGATAARADDVTCPAGQYLNDAGACAECHNVFSGNSAYCPGDNKYYQCPDPEKHMRTKFPDEYENPTITLTYYQPSSHVNYTDISQCNVLTWYSNVRGQFIENAKYNQETEEYDIVIAKNDWMGVYAGYYLTTRSSCGSFAYYYDAVACPAGAYCPGKEKVQCDASNVAVVHTETFGLEICPDNTYSDAGASTCTPCPHGYGNSGATPDAHAGIASCNTPIVCNAGEYLNDNNECTACESSWYYCPGDNVRYNCPDTQIYQRTTYPAEYCNPRPIQFATSNDRGNVDITDCLSYVIYETDCGEAYEYVTYNPATKQYDKIHTFNWRSAAPGYYLDNRYNPECAGNIYHYYKSVHKCPVGAYCPGKEKIKCNVGDPIAPTFGLESCADGTYTRITGATSADACLPLCDAGISRFHAGDYSFLLWNNSVCASPALRVGTDTGTCCVNLESGTASGALNIDTGTATYHTVN